MRPTSSETLPLPVWRALRRRLPGRLWGLLYSGRELARQRSTLRLLADHGLLGGGATGPVLGPADPEMVAAIERVWTLRAVDKLDAGYAPVYAPVIAELSGRPCRILEIGVFAGGSLRAWRDLLPDAEVVGYDIDDTVMFSEPGIRTSVVDQMNLPQLLDEAWLDGPFDLIVDDGWHQPQANATALAGLWPFLKVGGLYVVEDIAFRYSRFWGRVAGRAGGRFAVERVRTGVHELLLLRRLS